MARAPLGVRAGVTLALRLLMVAAAAATLLAVVGACGGDGGEEESDRGPEELVGVITAISRSDGEIRAFTVRSADETHAVNVDPALDYGFDLEHLEDHRRAGDPVRCRVERRDGHLVALAILDA